MWNLPIDPLATAFIRLGRNEWLICFARSRKCNRNMSRQRGRRSKNPWKSVVGSNEVSFSDGLCSEAMLVSGSVSSGWTKKHVFLSVGGLRFFHQGRDVEQFAFEDVRKKTFKRTHLNWCFCTSPAASGVNGCNNSTIKSTLIRVVSAIK